jgi:hypothetical protein
VDEPTGRRGGHPSGRASAALCGLRRGTLLVPVKSWILAPLLSFASCATIITGSNDSVNILSDPPGARFTTNSGHQGTTPATISIPDKLDLEVAYALDGYGERTVVLRSRMSGWIFGNILIGGLVGLVVDLATGDYRTHDSSVTGTLEPIAPGP